MDPIDIGTRLELFVDDHLIAERENVERRLHRPEPQEVAIVHDEPWEGGLSLYHTVFEDDDRYRMYYRAEPHDGEAYTAYAESDDGLDWRKPDVGSHEFEGSTRNNIVFGPEVEGISHNLTPFRDPTEDGGSDTRYKAVGAGDDGLLALGSPDGLEWSLVSEEPIFTREQGAFDSQNVVFWDAVRGEYRAYFRYFDGRRAIKTATSEDFTEWSDPVPLEYTDAPEEQLYTNGIGPYYRAPHIFVGFPARYVERDQDAESMRRLPGWEQRREELIEESGRSGYAVTDTLFMASRDGTEFERGSRAFIRPGLWKQDSTAQWYYGDNYPAWHVLETPSRTTEKPRELSLFASEKYRADATRMRRYSLRIDGFVSVEAALDGGEFVTEPLNFGGDEFVLNYATSAAGSVGVELQKPDGTPYDGFSLAESPELFGDDLERVVAWSGGRSVGELSGTPVRVRFVLSDADVYSLQFRQDH